VDKYEIQSDENNWKLVQKGTNTKTGEPTFRVMGYYNSPESLKRGVTEKMLRVHGVDDLVGAKKNILRILDFLKFPNQQEEK